MNIRDSEYFIYGVGQDAITTGVSCSELSGNAYLENTLKKTAFFESE